MAEVFTISGSGGFGAAACPAGWGVTPKGNCGAVGGGPASAATNLQVTLRALGVVTGDSVLKAVGVDGYIGGNTVGGVNRAMTKHVGPGQAAARFRTGTMTQVQVANEATTLATIIGSEVIRRGGVPPSAPPLVIRPPVVKPPPMVDVLPPLPPPSSGSSAAAWALVGICVLAVGTGVYFMADGRR